jgi:TPR repeat protein
MASDGGSSGAMNNLGDMYENGVGVPQDYAEAMKLYRQSATLGEGFAFRSIGSMWASGKAGKVNQRQAYLYYLLAAKIDDEPPPALPTVRQQLSGAEQLAIEAQAEKWKSGDPLPDVKSDEN